jgi:hypothetical protein
MQVNYITGLINERYQLFTLRPPPHPLPTPYPPAFLPRR